MTTNKKTRIRIAPGLYRRGDTYEIRVSFRDSATGKRRERWETIGPSKKDAKRALIAARDRAQNGTILAHRDENLTVSEFLRHHFLPYIDEERVAKAKNLHPNTALKYRGYVESKVIPVMGGLRVTQVNPGHIEGMLNQLRVGGRDHNAGVDVSRRRPEVVYGLILAKRDEGWSYSDIAVWLAATRRGDCAGLTKDAVAAICRRSRLNGPGTKQNVPGLSVTTVQKIHAMMRSAWRFGVNHGMIPRDRAYVIAEAPVPSKGKHEPESEIAVWTERDYSRFFDWAVIHRTDSWPAFFFVATSGDRISGNLGLRWTEVDLDSGTASLKLFVKYHGKPGKRVLVEPFGKTTAGHQIFLDPRTVAILRSLKARQAQELLARSDRHVCTTLERDCPLSGYHDRGLVFPQRDGNYRDPNKFLDLFQDAIRAHNRDNPSDPLPAINLHALRHGWSTIAGGLGVSDTVRMNRLDQSTLAVNRRYTHAQEAAMRAAAQTVSDAMFANSEELRRFGT